MTALTSIYQLEYLVAGDPVRITREVLERNTKRLEVLLQQKALAPPAAQDLATITGRVAALEATAFTAVAAANMNGWTNLGGGWAPLQYRREGKTVRILGTLAARNSAADQLIFTLPVGFRPAATAATKAMVGLSAVGQVNVNADGRVVLAPAGNWPFVNLNDVHPIP